MLGRPPTPVCKAFVICRQIFMDNLTQECVLVAPIHQVFLPEFPCDVDLAVYCRLTNAHGAYSLELQLRTLEGDVVCRDRLDAPLATSGPLQIWPVTLRHRHICFPAPGKYEFALLANEEEVVADVFWAHLNSPRE